jgi:hypothetical protein
MKALFWIFLTIDCLAFLVCFYETFFVSSNSSMMTVLLLVAACMGVGWWLRDSAPVWSLVAAGLPTAVVLLLFVGMLIGGSKSGWH